MHKEALDSGLFEVMFSQAVKDNFEKEIADLPSEEELAKTVKISEFHEARMKRLFKKAGRQERVKTTIKWAKQAAAVIAIIFLALSGSLMFARDVRVAVYATVCKCQGVFSTVL